MNSQGTVTAVGTRLTPGGELKSFSIKKSSGLFSGKMRVGSKTVGFQGAVLQSMQLGFGYFTVDKETGAAAFVAE
jgi:hypothetical protein